MDSLTLNKSIDFDFIVGFMIELTMVFSGKHAAISSFLFLYPPGGLFNTVSFSTFSWISIKPPLGAYSREGDYCKK